MKTLETGPGAGLTPEALGRLFDAFSRASRDIERSHAELQARVAALRKELADKDRQLERKKRLEALGLLVAGVAHEFRNPLGSVSLYLDCLSEAVQGLPGEPASEARGLIGKIETAVRHLDSVVEDMLVFTRGPASPPVPCDLERLLEEALLLLAGDLEAAGARLRVEAAPGLSGPGRPVVRAERDGVVRILLNVLKNGVEAVAGHRPRGEGRLWVSLSEAERGRDGSRWVEVSVRDNGPGVPPERLERLFVPFYTEKQRGVGLGLSIVHSLLERQGGRVEVENAAGGGLLVRLLFAAGPGGGGDGAERAPAALPAEEEAAR